MQPYGSEQHVAHRVPEHIDEYVSDFSAAFEYSPTAGDVFFEFGLVLAISLGIAVAARLLLVAFGAA
jgi:hypothetical protein